MIDALPSGRWASGALRTTAPLSSARTDELSEDVSRAAAREEEDGDAVSTGPVRVVAQARRLVTIPFGSVVFTESVGNNQDLLLPEDWEASFHRPHPGSAQCFVPIVGEISLQ